MAPKRNLSAGNQDNSRTQIILAMIGLVSALGVAYFGYRQVTDPVRLSSSITQTASANNNIALPITTGTNIPSETPIPTLEPSSTPTREVVLTPTLPPMITTQCLFSEIWDYTPRKKIPTDGCWKVAQFAPFDNGVEITEVTPLNSGEQQRGFYALLTGNTEVLFTVKIRALDSLSVSPDKTQRSNLAFGIVEGSPFNYYNGIYVYYYASKPDVYRYEAQVAKEQDVSYSGALSVDRTQTIRFKIEGKRLTVYIDGEAVNEYTLTFKQNAFYFGYRLFENTELSALMSNLSISH